MGKNSPKKSPKKLPQNLPNLVTLDLKPTRKKCQIPKNLFVLVFFGDLINRGDKIGVRKKDK
jgi:hypothetical protein